MKKILAVLSAFALVACAQQSPSVQSGPDAETTFDGLVRIDNSRFRNAWVDPDIDVTRYNKVIPGGAEFEFRAVKDTGGSTHRARNNTSEFYISEDNRAKLVDVTTAIFQEEVGKSKHFTVTDQPAADALIIRGAMLDIVSHVPPDMIGRGEVYLSSVGEATLVLEARDSLSGQVVFRAVDRRAAEQTGSYMQRSNSVTTWAEVRRMARRWATRLREGLDSIHE